MTRLLAVGTDFIQPPAAELGSTKKIAFAQAASGLYVPASVLADENGNTIDSAIAALAGTERGLVTRNMLQGIGTSPLLAKALVAGGQGLTALPVWPNAYQAPTWIFAQAVGTGTLSANIAKAVWSFEHSALALKTLKLRRVLCGIENLTATAGKVFIEIVQGSAASSAGTVQVAVPTRQNGGSPEVVIKSLPTITAGSTPAANSHFGLIAASGAALSQVVYDWQEDGETIPLTMRAGALESFVVMAQANAAIQLNVFIMAIFTEE